MVGSVAPKPLGAAYTKYDTPVAAKARRKTLQLFCTSLVRQVHTRDLVGARGIGYRCGGPVDVHIYT